MNFLKQLILLFQQITIVGMPAWSTGIVFGRRQKGITLWMSSEGVLQTPFRAPLTEDPSFNNIGVKRTNVGKHFCGRSRRGRISKHYQYMRTLPVGRRDIRFNY
jgi:hypothetical protein